VGLLSPSPWAVPPCLAVAQYSCFAVDPSASWLISPSLSSLAPPTRATMACSTTNLKTCINGVLGLLWEVRAMVEKMAAAEEVKRATPSDVAGPPHWYLVLMADPTLGSGAGHVVHLLRRP
jgi:hypothetical protein